MGLGAALAVLTGPPLPHRPFEIPTAAPPRGLLFLRALQAGASVPCCPRGSQPVSMRGVPTTPRCGVGGSSSPPALLTLCLSPQTEPCGADPWQGRSRSTEVPEQVAAHPGPGAGEIGGAGGALQGPGLGADPVPCPQDGTLLYSSLLARGQQDATATFTMGFQASSYKVGAPWGVGRWVLGLGALGSCDLGPGMMWLFTATPCGLGAGAPCS